MIQAILDFFYRSQLAPLLAFGFFGLNCLLVSWLLFRFYRRTLRLAFILALSIMFLFFGLTFVFASLTTAKRSIVDFSYLIPWSQIGWIFTQGALLVVTYFLLRGGMGDYVGDTLG